jgi:hypothetical protein
MLLIYEGQKGVSMQLVDDCKPGEFAGFYIGLAGQGCGRYSVAAHGQGEVGEKCDAAQCKDLPLTLFIESSVPCPFFNAVTNEAKTNITLFRQHLFSHVLNEKKVLCIFLWASKRS